MTQHRDLHDFRGGLNADDAPSQLPQGDYTGAKNVRTGGSDEQHGEGPAEILQSEIEILIAPDTSMMYYGGSIGGQFVYSGYSEITIGTQTWMRRNYDVNYPGSKVYNDVEANAAIYGRLYTHNMIMSTGFVPDGWRVPTEADINTLLTYLGGLMIAGGKMKEVGESHWTTPNAGADDISGFRAIPGGKFDLLFELLGNNCLLWLQDEGEPLAPVALNASERTAVTFVANWLISTGATGYYLDVATDAAFTAFVAGFNSLNVGNVLFKEVTGLAPVTPYYFRVRAYNEVGASENSNTQTTTTLPGADWFCPSIDELRKIYENLYLFGVGGFGAGDFFWSSSEVNATTAKALRFWTGVTTDTNKFGGAGYKVCACRSFNSTTVYALRDIGPAGGLIFHIIDLGMGNYTYYEAEQPGTFGTGRSWIDFALQGTFIGAVGTIIGTGQANTTTIVTFPGATVGAVVYCDSLI